MSFLQIIWIQNARIVLAERGRLATVIYDHLHDFFFLRHLKP